MTASSSGDPTEPVEAPEAGSLSTQIVFVQGGGAGVHDEWDDRLVASLQQALGARFTIHYPRMPDEGDPNAVAWRRVIARELGELPEGVILVGHSIGAAILLDHLASDPPAQRLGGVFLLSTPYIGEGGWPSDELRPTSDLSGDCLDGTPLFFYQGLDDDTVPLAHVELLAKAFPRATIRRLEGRDHQLGNDLSEVARDILLLSERRQPASSDAAR